MIKVSSRPLSAKSGDTIVYLVRERKGGSPLCPDPEVSARIKQAFSLGDFRGKAEERLVFYRPAPAGGRKVAKPVRVMVVGLGKDEPGREVYRKVGGAIARVALKITVGKMRLQMPEDRKTGPEEVGQALAEGLILGSYRFDKYKKVEDPDEQPHRIKEIIFHTSEASPVNRGVARGMITATAACWARDMANEPGNFWTPSHFSEAGRQLAEKGGLACKVLDKAAMKKKGMGGIIGVNQGSAQPPQMVILEYRGGSTKPPLLLVGKGLTFDSGGISLKPGAGMQDMKFDMCGGAAVMAVMQALGELKPAGLDVVGIIPAAENLPGPEALKPGDVITQYNGKTVEVVNTDAEGRLILADALAYGIEKYKPSAVVDIATLTGAVIIGLGHHLTGLLSNNDKLAARLLASGKKCGEPMWRLPLGDDFKKQLKSEVADLKNVGGRPAGTITGACFLQEFVGKTPWAHLDIAGTAWDYTRKSYVPKGPSGIGVRTLVELILNWK